jgi:hypothetical protein
MAKDKMFGMPDGKKIKAAFATYEQDKASIPANTTEPDRLAMMVALMDSFIEQLAEAFK